jgi:precorrin-2 dehydrogenase/sirohydrochlorin ferrochelatase
LDTKRECEKLYPINLDLAGKTVLVLGGGKVAWRKIRRLIKAQAQIVLISPRLITKLEKKVANNDRINYHQRLFQDDDLKGKFFLVFAVTDDNIVNQQIANLAKEKNLLVNVATSCQSSNFTLPATIERGDLLLTVATNGLSPALSRELRKKLELDFGTEYALFLEMMKEIRPVILAEIDEEEERRGLFRKLADLDLINLLATNRQQGLKIIEEKLPDRIIRELDFVRG